MIVGVALVEMRVHGSQSLKAKRGVVRSIQQRVRNRFHIAVSEVGGQGTWQSVQLGLAAVGAEAAPVRSVLNRALRFIEELHLAEVLDTEVELLSLPHRDSYDEERVDMGPWDAEE